MLSATKKISTDIVDNRLGQLCDGTGTSMNEEATDGDSADAVRAEARRRESEELAKMDGLDLADAEIMRNAWRCHDAEADIVSVVTRQNPEPHSTEGTR